MSQGPIIRQFNIHGTEVPRVQCPQVPLFPWTFVSISLVLCSQCRMLTDPCSMALSFYSFIYPKTCPCCPIFPVFHVHIFPYYQSPISRRSYAPRGLRTQYSWRSYFLTFPGTLCCFNVPLSWKNTAIEPDAVLLKLCCLNYDECYLPPKSVLRCNL